MAWSLTSLIGGFKGRGRGQIPVGKAYETPIGATSLRGNMKHFLVPALALTAIVFASPAHGDIAGFGPYVGQWASRGERLIVNPDGSGQETYNGGFVNFQIVDVDGDNANGSVTGASNPLTNLGKPAYLQLAAKGQVLKLYITDGDDFFPFCKVVNGGKSHCGA